MALKASFIILVWFEWSAPPGSSYLMFSKIYLFMLVIRIVQSLPSSLRGLFVNFMIFYHWKSFELEQNSVVKKGFEFLSLSIFSYEFFHIGSKWWQWYFTFRNLKPHVSFTCREQKSYQASKILRYRWPRLQLKNATGCELCCDSLNKRTHCCFW